MQRTLHEQAIGFHVERGKRRNLLNSAGSDNRPGTLGHRSNSRALTDTYCVRADGSRYTIKRGNRTTTATTVEEPAIIRTKHYSPPRRPIMDYLPYVDSFPNVLTLHRARPTTSRTIDVSLGSGRGW